MIDVFTILLRLVLSLWSEPFYAERIPPYGCLESVHVVAPGNEVTCPWGTLGRVTPTGEGNVAFHCVCPKNGGAE